MVLYTAVLSVGNASAALMMQDGFSNLGYYSLAATSFMFAFSSIFSTAIVEALGTKLSIFIGSLNYVFSIACYLFPVYYQ